MIQVLKFHHKYLIRAAIVLSVGALLVCGCVRFDIGMDALAPNNRWITVVEHSGDPPGYRLRLVDVQEGKSTFLPSPFAQYPVSSFSPDNRYVLFLDATIAWALVEIGTDQRIQVARWPDLVSFLPDGNLLTIKITNGLKQLLIADPTHPYDITLVKDRVRHMFPAPEDLSGRWDLGICPLSQVLHITDHSLWLIVDADDEVYIFDTSRARDPVSEVNSGPANNIKTLIARQSELASQVEEQVNAKNTERIANNLLVSFSPDGKKLLFLSIEPENRYSLYLINLTSEGEPAKLFLSMQADWRPSFAFSSDGQRVLFESNLTGERSLYWANADGTDIQSVAKNTEGACLY